MIIKKEILKMKVRKSELIMLNADEHTALEKVFKLLEEIEANSNEFTDESSSIWDTLADFLTAATDYYNN